MITPLAIVLSDLIWYTAYDILKPFLNYINNNPEYGEHVYNVALSN
jgi:hypothetical protein